MIDESRAAVAFTGAGISTESGIPDFRSPGGLWSRYQPIEYDEFVASETARRAYWRRKFATHEAIEQARPNLGHRAIAALVEAGPIQAVITQNVDGLHRLSGVPDEKVIELHGNTTYAHCLDCGVRYELAPIRAAFEQDEVAPLCQACGGLVKTATISFGQAMPQAEMRRAEEATRRCDLFLAIGSSLRVFPAAALPELAKAAGARLVIINREPTALDAVADLVVHEEIGGVLEAFLDGHRHDSAGSNDSLS